MEARERWLSAGLFCTTFAILVLEILDTRLLSVLTWYHLSFFAISIAMLGMAAGAVRVYLGGERFEGERARRSLASYGYAFAWSIPLSHGVNLVVPVFELGRGALWLEVLAIVATTVALTVPFFLSGVVVTLALTRIGGSIGRLYGFDLLGAALGCVLVIPLLASSNITSVALAATVVAAMGAWCFARVADARGWSWRPLVLAGGVGLLAVGNGLAGAVVGPMFARGYWLRLSEADRTAWNTHSFVIVSRPKVEPVFLWGPGRALEPDSVSQVAMVIDGQAVTPITRWNGNPATLDWVRHDVTTLPYHLRQGSAAVIGVGGGRDVLAAIWGGNHPITGIEINDILLDALTRTHRDFAGLADYPGVRLVHDEARSYLTRTSDRYDILQMSLIDTWAATGAGAFTLSENGLYTRQAWRVFLDVLTPSGVFSVSRWFSPTNVSETNRLAALGVAALLDHGVGRPQDHLILAARGRVATLMLSRAPFSEADRAVVQRVVHEDGVAVLAAPWISGSAGQLDRIVSSRTPEALRQATDDFYYDFRPPDDARPYFFNILKPRALLRWRDIPAAESVIQGNVRATWTLVLLFAIATALVIAIIGWPLVRAGFPRMGRSSFGWSLLYFAIIGIGFMLIQIALLQRFSVYLGHPTHTLAVILFSMILFAGAGSFLSDRLRLDRRHLYLFLPPAIAGLVLLVRLLQQPAIDATIHLGLVQRAAIVVAFTAPLSLLLGFCFPIGMRLVGRLSPRAAAWMWGVNGACGVLATIAAVAVSMWVGIDANLVTAAALYLALAAPMSVLAATGEVDRVPLDGAVPVPGS